METTLHNVAFLGEDDADLATRAAWLYHAGGLTQSEVAQKLGIGNARAHRLIVRAARAGLVRVLVDGPIGGCIGLEDALSRRFALRFCRVVPSLGESGLPLRALGIAAASFLHDTLERDAHRVIGVGHGRTLASAVVHLPRVPAPNVRFVSLLGGLPRLVHTSPFDVLQQLGERTGADAYLMPAPMFANTAHDREVLCAQRGVAETLALGQTATLALVGIGAVASEAFLLASGVLTENDIIELRASGAVGEVLGRYFAADGSPVATMLHDRVIAIDPAVLRGRDVIAVAGGAPKVSAINAVLQTGLLTGLISDEATARGLVAANT